MKETNSTAARSRRSAHSSGHYIFKSMAIVLTCYAAALGCMMLLEISGSAWWALGFMASWTPAAAWLLKEKGGRA